jgi:tetratricopeptide (TPR) repeat protein
MESKNSSTVVMIDSSSEGAEPSGQSPVQGVGVGVGVMPPGVSEGPSAKAESESTQSSAQTVTNLLIDVSPVEVVKGGGIASARTEQYTPIPLADFELFRTLMRARDYGSALSLCSERLLVARTERETLVWTKDAAIVERARGRYDSAFTLQASVYRIAERTAGTARGKYHNGLALTHALRGETRAALSNYEISQHFLSEVGALLVSGQVDNNAGRLLTSTGAPEKSFKHFDRAERVAEKCGDALLLGEVLESRALAYEASGDLPAAFEASSRSVLILSGTEELAAYMESCETHARLFSLVRGTND